jgi:hypothetical protein
MRPPPAPLVKKPAGFGYVTAQQVPGAKLVAATTTPKPAVALHARRADAALARRAAP